jgi:hypothetical protein
MALRYLEALLNSWQWKVISIIIITMLTSGGILASKLPMRNVFGPSILSLGYNSPLLLMVNLSWTKQRISELLGSKTAKPCSLQFRIKGPNKGRCDGNSRSKILSVQSNLEVRASARPKRQLIRN